MIDTKHDSKFSLKDKALVLACLAITLLGIALFRIYFPALRNELHDTLFITALLVLGIAVFRRRK